MIVRVIGDDRDLQRAMKRDEKAVKDFGDASSSHLQKFDSAFTRSQKILAGGFLAGAAVTGAVSFLKGSVDAASDLNEQITKSEAVFGDSADAVLAWSQTTAKSLGISERAALEASGTFGNLFKSIGINGPEAAKTSEQLVQLASDLASFNNANPEDVLDALRSGLIGEAEPLRKFGVLLSEARVQQLAMAETGKTSAKELTNQEKALARLSIIFKDTGAAQGDFGRTSGGLANQQRILSAAFENLRANIGTSFLPIMKAVTGDLVKASEQTTAFVNALQDLSDVRIPPIRIPFVIEQQKGTTLGSLASKALFTFPEFVDLTANQIRALIDDFKEGAEGQTPKLAAEFESSLNSMFTNALSQASSNAKPDTSKVKGFGTGLTPEDLFGPIIKDLPDKLELAINEADILTPKNKSDDLSILKRARDVMLGQFTRPDIEPSQKNKIAKVVKSLQGDIDSITSSIAANAKKSADIATKSAKDAKDKQRKGFENTFDLLSLDLDRDKLTARFSDDLKDIHALQKVVQEQIKVEGKTPDLLGKLFDLRDKQKEILSDRTQGRQFKALGLTATGEEIIPGAENLNKQLKQLQDRLGKTGQDLPAKLAQRLAGARKLLSGEFGKLDKDVRDKINQLFKTIRDTFDQESKRAIPQDLHVQLSDKILKALGFDQNIDATKLTKLRPAPFRAPTFATAAAGAAATGTAGVTITGPVTVVADNPDAFLRELQKKAGRTSGMARGRFPGRSLGLG
jgi:hypothetical protein